MITKYFSSGLFAEMSNQHLLFCILFSIIHYYLELSSKYCEKATFFTPKLYVTDIVTF